MEPPTKDAFTPTTAKLDSIVGGAAKLNAFSENVSRIDTILERSDCHVSIPVYRPDYLEGFQRASAALNQAQRGWLAKGLRDWSSYVASAINWAAVEVQRDPFDGVFDLRTFLHRRQMRGMQRHAQWAQRSGRVGRVRAWLLSLGDRLLWRVATGLRTESSVPKVLLAILKAPPGWTLAMRFRVIFQSSLPRILEQLAEVIAPNAPSRLSPPRRFLIAAGAAPTN